MKCVRETGYISFQAVSLPCHVFQEQKVVIRTLFVTIYIYSVIL